jgi:hypothetical protein
MLPFTTAFAPFKGREDPLPVFAKCSHPVVYAGKNGFRIDRALTLDAS